MTVTIFDTENSPVRIIKINTENKTSDIPGLVKEVCKIYDKHYIDKHGIYRIQREKTPQFKISP